MEKTIETYIQKLRRTKDYIELSAYYSQTTILNVFGIERSENRHSAFIAWLLNPNSSHLLGDAPLRKFLSMVAAIANNGTNEQLDSQNEVPPLSNNESLKSLLFNEKYSIQIEDIQTEQPIINLVDAQNNNIFNDIVDKDKRKGDFKKDEKNRFDIWIELKINDNEGQEWIVPIILENKIYSKEGCRKDDQKHQTDRYAEAITILNNLHYKNKAIPIMVYLTPSSGKGPHSKQFVHVTYQDLLDHVIMPTRLMAKKIHPSIENMSLFDGYIRNLSMPSINKKGSKDYSILAVSLTEREQLEKIFKSEAFQIALTHLYNDVAKNLYNEVAKKPDVKIEDLEKIIGIKTEDIIQADTELIQQFWDANEDLFKIVLYSYCMDDKELLNIINPIINKTNRDNTRYWVSYKIGDEVVSLTPKPVPKSMASQLIAEAYCKQQQNQVSLDDLREAFPGNEIRPKSSYLKELFYDINGTFNYDKGTRKDNPIDIAKSWDFYPDRIIQYTVSDGIRMVKKWRKDDFEKLIEWAKEKHDIIVKPSS